jgi:hypothetical protein
VRGIKARVVSLHEITNFELNGMSFVVGLVMVALAIINMPCIALHAENLGQCHPVVKLGGSARSLWCFRYDVNRRKAKAEENLSW